MTDEFSGASEEVLPHINDLIREYEGETDDVATERVLDDLEPYGLSLRARRIIYPAVKRQVRDVFRSIVRLQEQRARSLPRPRGEGPPRRWQSPVRELGRRELRALCGARIKVPGMSDHQLADTMSPTMWRDAAEFKYRQANETRNTGNHYDSVAWTLRAYRVESIKEYLSRPEEEAA